MQATPQYLPKEYQEDMDLLPLGHSILWQGKQQVIMLPLGMLLLHPLLVGIQIMPHPHIVIDQSPVHPLSLKNNEFNEFMSNHTAPKVTKVYKLHTLPYLSL